MARAAQTARPDAPPWRWSEAGLVLALVALYAASDEFHQTFVPSRQGCVRDVLLDTPARFPALLVGVFFSVAERLGSLLSSRHSMKRPLLPVALLYVGGILIARFISLPPLLLLAGSLGLAALTLAWPRARLVGLCALIVLTGWTNHTLRTAILSPHDLRRILGEQPEIVTLRGTAARDADPARL